LDVSDEMIRMAAERFRGSSTVHLHVTNGADLAPLASGYFDFVYSYAVFQHIPSRDVVLAYFAEIRRVLKEGGIAQLQLNGLPPDSQAPNTWEGLRFSGEEVAEYARAHDFQLLALEGTGTQYLWTTWRKQPDGWRAGLHNPGLQARIERSGNAYSGEPLVPASSRFAYASFRMESLSPDCDLNDLRVTFDGTPGVPCYIGPEEWGGLHQLNVLLPPGVRTGIVPVELLWLGEPLCAPAWLRIIPPGPAVPRVSSVSDGTNLLAGTRIESRTVKVTLEDLSDADAVTVAIDAVPVTDFEWLQTDARAGRVEFNIHLPADLERGSHQIELCRRSRRFPPLAIEVV